MTIQVLNGPNLGRLGTREPEKYGTATLDDVEALCAEVAEELGLAIDFRQTNGEGELVTYTRAEVNRRIKAVAARLQHPVTDSNMRLNMLHLGRALLDLLA